MGEGRGEGGERWGEVEAILTWQRIKKVKGEKKRNPMGHINYP